MTPAPSPTPPPFWTLWVTWYLEASPALARQLWRVFVLRHSHALLWHLDQCAEVPSDIEVYMRRLKGVTALVTPQDLLAATARLSPPGARRRPEVVQLEEAILAHLDATGAWL